MEVMAEVVHVQVYWAKLELWSPPGEFRLVQKAASFVNHPIKF